MNDTARAIRNRMRRFRYEFRSVSIVHLAELQDSVGRLVRAGLLNMWLHEKWHFYLKTNENLPEAKTIVLVAMPQPLIRISFLQHGTAYYADIPPTYFTKDDDSRAEEILKELLGADGYKVAKAHLALKTLAVRSGLARYGKNNIAYVPGMGSMCQLVAFYTDWPCEEDAWQESEMMEVCQDCSLCRENCPTGSISTDRFLIHADKCLGSLAEKEPDSAPWVRLQPDWRNAFIGCMQCQFVCPVNRQQAGRIVAGPSFTEEETDLILGGTLWTGLPPETRHKLAGTLDGFYSFMAVNLRALVRKQGGKQDQGTG